MSEPSLTPIPGADPGACPGCGAWVAAGMQHRCPVDDTAERCRIFGHEWVPLDPIRYEQAETTLDTGERVPVTWVTDEVCARCGAESRWPT